MSDLSQKNRIAIDLDDLERQLRGTAAAESAAPKADPLEELARLVGQDDPLKTVFGVQNPTPAPEVRIEPRAPMSYAAPQPPAQEAPQAQIEPQREMPASPDGPVEAELRGVLDEFDAIFARQGGQAPAAPTDPALVPEIDSAGPGYSYPEAHVEPAAQAAPGAETYDDPVARDLERVLEEHRMAQDGGYGAGAGYAPVVSDFAEAEAPPYEEPKPRFGKGMIAAGVLIAVAVGGVGLAALWRGGGKAGGEPPVIAANTGPTKVQPENPGGAKIPDQDKQIYERGAAPKPAETKVVNREEQPVDVQALARNAARTGAPEGQGGAAAPFNAALGEPRKVRTISIRPDGSIVGVAPSPAASAPPRTLPQIASTPPAAIPAEKPAAPVTPPSPEPAQAAPETGNETTPAAPVQRAQAPKPTPKPAAKPPAQRAPMAITPKVVASAPAEPAPAAPEPDPVETTETATADGAQARTRSGGGNFVVQLGAPGSDAEARSTFASLQRRYPGELGGERPMIRKAEVGGRAVYRLRVGPYSREEAQALCSKLQGRGGQCFIAKN